MKKGANTQQKIIDQAIIQASKHGIAGLTIGSLAAALKMSKSGLFAHFGSKINLQKKVIESVFNQYTQDIIEPALSIPEGSQQVLGLMNLWVRWSKHEKRPGGCPLASSLFDPTALDSEVKALLQSGMNGLSKVLRNCIESAKAIDLDDSIDTEQLILQLVGIYYSQHINYWLLGDTEATASALQAVKALLVLK